MCAQAAVAVSWPAACPPGAITVGFSVTPEGNSSSNEENMGTLLCGISDEIRQFLAGNPELFPRTRICSIVKEAKVLIFLPLTLMILKSEF